VRLNEECFLFCVLIVGGKFYTLQFSLFVISAVICLYPKRRFFLKLGRDFNIMELLGNINDVTFFRPPTSTAVRLFYAKFNLIFINSSLSTTGINANGFRVVISK
jgi:hypothetical protein